MRGPYSQEYFKSLSEAAKRASMLAAEGWCVEVIERTRCNEVVCGVRYWRELD